MTDLELKNLKKGIVLTAAYYGRDLNPDVLGMMAEDLADLPFEKVSEAFLKYRRDPKNKTFPLPAQIREIVDPSVTPDHAAREVSSRIIEAIDRYGYTWPEDARAYIGEIGWSVVRVYGGWQNFCEGMGVRFSIDQFNAQCRELVKGRVVHGSAIGDYVQALPYETKEKDLQLESSKQKEEYQKYLTDQKAKEPDPNEEYVALTPEEREKVIQDFIKKLKPIQTA